MVYTYILKGNEYYANGTLYSISKLKFLTNIYIIYFREFILFQIFDMICEITVNNIIRSSVLASFHTLIILIFSMADVLIGWLKTLQLTYIISMSIIKSK